MGRTSDAKARLLESAMELMYVRGYTAVGVQEICEHAGVNKGSFYYFFPSKRTLALEVIAAYGQRVRDMWQDAMAVDGPLLERLQRVSEYVYNTHRTLVEANGQMHGCPIGNLALELSCQDEDIRQRLHDTFTSWTEAVEYVLHQAIAAGELPALDTSIMAQMIVAYFEGVVMLAKIQNDPDVVQRLAHGAMHLVEALCR
jgi:TetR/AcrR family transcriptional regulator, transcriptional repressor for nem operon